MFVFSVSTVSSWTCLCTCPTKWLLLCTKQVVCPTSLLFAFCLQSLQAAMYPKSPNLCLYFQQALFLCGPVCAYVQLSGCHLVIYHVICRSSAPHPFSLLSVSSLYNLQFIQRVQTCACIFSKHCFFVDLFVHMSNQVAVTMYETG